MTRFAILTAMGLGLATLLGLSGFWLWHQRGRKTSSGRKAVIASVLACDLGLLTLLAGGLQILWHKRRSLPATEDARIIDRADASPPRPTAIG